MFYTEELYGSEVTEMNEGLNHERNHEETAVFTLNEYRTTSAVKLAALIRQGVTTPGQLIDYAVEVIGLTNKDLNNIITLRIEEAKTEAEALEDTGQPFYGVPLLIKGVGHAIEGGNNSLGISFLEKQVFDETGDFVTALQAAGFIVIGQTTYPQMGWLNVTNSALYNDTHNPWNLGRNPGGSSGGSAAAVVVGQVPIASTSDSGGSTRIPASFSGLIGLHPTQGILLGNPPNGQTSQFSIMKKMEDMIALFDFLLLKEAAEKVDVRANLLSNEIKVAYTYDTPAGTLISGEAVKAVEDAVAFMKSQGFATVEVDYPVDGKEMMYNYYLLAAAATDCLDDLAKKNLERNLKKDDVELLTWALYQYNLVIEEEDINQAAESLARLSEKLAAFHDDYPIFITATTAYPAPSADYRHIPRELIATMEDMTGMTKEERAELIYKQWLSAWTITPYTQLSNLTGTPSLSLPTHLTEEGLPLGVLFHTAKYRDRLLLQIGKMFENHHLFINYFETIELL